ncbi:ABC transporter ATP-binding protein [Thermatribacter velox]|jgi:peptide/nickel transport system ATP-binding protein|uniref:ABC transporter ATP-binding protein n=1 Tax=Thermatribacter velox TaxID=3039681 RepID=A0ABZ2YDK5_9BACT
MHEVLLEVKGLRKFFHTSRGTVKAVNEVSFTVSEGETLGLVGESGSGKSTVAYMVMGMYRPTAGEIIFEGKNIAIPHQKRPLSIKKNLQIVFQDPGSSLNPRRSIGQILELPLRIHLSVPPQKREEKLEELLSMVELPVDYLKKYPRALGGGERQMVAIARALSTNPRLVVLDEPTSALDVSIQAKIINTLMRIQKERKLGYLFITHDLSLMRNIAHRVAIMYLGRIVELAPAREFFEKPLHPYTQMLIAAVPVVSEEEERFKPEKVVSRGEIPSPINLPSGCVFHPRCISAEERCRVEEPPMVAIDENHLVRCHLYR